MVVCIVDTGLNPAKLPENSVLAGCNFVAPGDRDGWVETRNDHATAVARTILSAAPGTRLVSVRILDAAGELDDLAIVDAAFGWIGAARERLGIRIVCCAIADMTHNRTDLAFRGTPLQCRVAELRALGVLTIAPAGNFRQTRPGDGMPWPAILREVVSVGGLERAAAPSAPLEIAPRSQRLYPTAEHPYGTAAFALPGEPGETSGACARVVGALAASMARDPQKGAESHWEELLARSVPIEDADGRAWSALSILS